MNDISEDLDEDGFIVISTIPVAHELESKNIQTPPDNKQHIGETTSMAKIQAMFNQLLGEMVAYEAEGDGRFFQDMVPKASLSKTQTSLGSSVELEIHTEQAFSKLKPDFLSLGCLRSDPEAQTHILHKNQIIKNLAREKIPFLYQPLWVVGIDMSFKMDKNIEFIETDIRGPMPIIHKENQEHVKLGYYHCSIGTDKLVFDQDLMVGMTEESEKLKNDIIKLYNQQRKSYVLQQGDIVILDNRHVVHGRSSFRPKYDGYDRFILRSFVFDNVKYKDTYYTRKNDKRMIEAIYS
jgi:L-asparagine oxygenase